MSINGAWRSTRFIPAEEAPDMMEALRAQQREVFGEERMAALRDNAAPAEVVDELTWCIEELCTDSGSQTAYSIGSRTLLAVNGQEYGRSTSNLVLTWNPAGVVGGFGMDPGWDGAIASVSGIVDEVQWLKIPRHMPCPHQVKEGIFVDRPTGEAMVRRTCHALGFNKTRRTAIKPATAQEVATTVNGLKMHIAQQTTARDHLPVYVEVGYGLDPAALRGQRNFTNKMSINVDKAEGNYENAHGAYPDAVQQRSRQYAHYVQQQKAGQHILFAIGDAGRLPLPDNTAREIFMSNVLNAPLDEGVRRRLTVEAGRVLQKTGSLALRVNWHQDEWPHDQMATWLHQHDFMVHRSVGSTEPEHAILETQYGVPQEVPAPEGYYIFASPRQK